ncbi:50S ribosomal protein L5 [Candidatus Babela massiliensis]|uniref:Large ribosomal subunit protein uL5 n=1 Tax=Candidatus Babela massiliensis TaxID=673862 RepID=V6DJ13_9BACT|nr:50S ribosomal protein L5 [Candidatus Babela massiliensis]CDK30501.1 Ribosomal protein L5 [Candidatus Babela massiliensis]
MSKNASDVVKKSRLEELYVNKLRPELQKNLNLSNIMEVPKLDKIVINVGVKEAVADSRILNTVIQTIDSIAGQKSVKTLAKKSIAGFKIREDMPIGVRVTLRRKKMYDFLDKLINIALPKVRDFQGVPTKFDGRGNYNLGIKEWIIFPEVDSNIEKTFGLNITICMTGGSNANSYELLKVFGMPFKRN